MDLMQTFHREQDAIDYLLSQQIYRSRDDLPAALRSYWTDANADCPLPVFHHPFYVGFGPLVLPVPISEVLHIREQDAYACLDERDWDGFVFRHERAYRPSALFEAYRRIRPVGAREAVAFWQTVAHVWVDAEMDEDRPEWGRMLRFSVPHREAMMTSAARRALRQMPDRITVFRGVQAATSDAAHEAATRGYQWTLSQKTAIWFARRFLNTRSGLVQPYLATATVSKADVVAYLTRRGEDEIILPPGTVPVDRITLKAVPGPIS